MFVLILELLGKLGLLGDLLDQGSGLVLEVIQLFSQLG